MVWLTKEGVDAMETSLSFVATSDRQGGHRGLFTHVQRRSQATGYCHAPLSAATQVRHSSYSIKLEDTHLSSSRNAGLGHVHRDPSVNLKCPVNVHLVLIAFFCHFIFAWI